MSVVVLSGGVGGARFLRGLVDVAGGERITVVGNVGDDLEVLGLHVSPDLDSVLYALAGRMRDPGTIGPWYYYVLCAIAFVGWAFSATTVGTDLFGVDHAVTPAILSTVVLLVPLVDELATRFWPTKA